MDIKVDGGVVLRVIAILIGLGTILVLTISAQQEIGHTSTVTLWWDDSVAVLGEDPADWRAWVDFELRRDEAVVDSQSRLTDCEAALDPGVGQCGTPVEVTWEGLDAGEYEVWTRLRWTDGSEEVFGWLAPRTISDTQHFWLREMFAIQAIYLPWIMK